MLCAGIVHLRHFISHLGALSGSSCALSNFRLPQQSRFMWFWWHQWCKAVYATLVLYATLRTYEWVQCVGLSMCGSLFEHDNFSYKYSQYSTCPAAHKADSRFAPSQWEMPLQSNVISHWLGANLESAFAPSQWEMPLQSNVISHWLGTNLESALSTSLRVRSELCVVSSMSDLYSTIVTGTYHSDGPLLSSWFNIDSNMDKWLHLF